MKKITVIIISWNARGYLRNCLTSLRKTCQGLNIEVIVVDNASSDGSPEVVTEFPGVKLVSTGANLGFARANNLGMKMATGDYFALVNSDVVVHPGCFQVLTQFLDAHPEVGLAGPRIVGGDGKLQRTCRRLPTVWNTFCRALALDSILGRWPLFSGREMRHWNHDSLTEIEALSGCFLLARREAVIKVGGLDEKFFFYAEDVDWCKRFRESGWKVVYVPGASATHFGGGSSANAPLRYSIELLRANLTYWRKHRGLAGQTAFYLLSIFHCGLRILARGLTVILRRNSDRETAHKFEQSRVCLRWLLTRKGV